MLLKSSSSDSQLSLEESFDFNALPEPLSELGLTRNHFTDIQEYKGVQKDNITKSVVIALDKFRSQNQKPTTFVNKWINILCARCNSLTPKQLKLKVQKVIKQHRTLVSRNDKVGLKDFHECFFIDNTNTIKEGNDEDKCKKCLPIVKENEERKLIIKELEQENINLTSKLNLECEINAAININKTIVDESHEFLKQNNDKLKKELKKIKDVQKSSDKECIKLKTQTYTLENELEIIKDKTRTYKNNVSLKKECEDLKLQVHNLEEEVSKKEKDGSFDRDKVKELKRKTESERAQKCKWKSKFRKLQMEFQDNLMYHNQESENATVESDTSINLREGQHNKFNSSVRLTYMVLQGEADVPASKCSKVVDIVSHHLHGKKIKGLPCTSSALNMADEGHHIAKQHIADKLLHCKHFTFASDGTSRQKRHFMERHVILDDGTTLSLGFSEIASDDAKSMLEQAVEILEEICRSVTLCDDEGDDDIDIQLKWDQIFLDILRKMKSLMSDRASNMKKFDQLFHEFKKEKLGPEDASTLFLFCNAHFLLGLSSGTEKVLKLLEENISLPGTQFGNSHLFFGQQASLSLVRCSADVFGPRGDEKNGCREEWLSYCRRKNITSKFESYRDNRFNNVYQNSCALIEHKDDISEFLDKFGSNSNKKLTDIRSAIANTEIITTVLSVAIFNKLLTKPYWDLMNSQTPYSAFPNYVKEMDSSIRCWTSMNNHDDIVQLSPVFADFQSQSLDFHAQFTSGVYDRELFTKTFCLIASDMLDVLHRQLFEFLGDGIFAGDIPYDVRAILDKCPLTNLVGERLFGDFDYDITKRRHSTTHHRSTLSMWKHNNIGKWLSQKSRKEQKLIMERAQKEAKPLRKEHREAVEREKRKIDKKIAENAQKKNDKEMFDLEQRNKVLDSILKKGFCNSEEDLNELYINGTVEDLKSQIRYRKLFHNQKSLKVTGTKKQLFDTLHECIIPS